MSTRQLVGNRQSGQTLIETIVAVFVLVMALSSGLALAIYASSTSADSREEVTAIGLAREGVEAIRMLRDTNWLSAEDIGSVDDLYETNGGCTYSATDRKPCYPEAFDEPYDLESTGNDNDYRVKFDPSAATNFTLDRRNGTESYLLCRQADGTYRHNDGGITCDGSTARFARRVTITTGNIASPFTRELDNPTATGGAPNFGGHSPEKIITSVVVWQGRKCAAWPANITGFDPVTFATNCKVTMVERLTNWKDYR